ncbi:MAG TPA: thymidine phosphorylase [Acidobacteria bacterium]|nr:thymidine phosphorylase [Acidobacteriota bacterium]
MIRRKISGVPLSAGEIDGFIQGVTDNSVRDEEIAAFCMAVYLRGMVQDEVLALTRAMLHSGEVLEWNDLPGPAVDKHSTGGVGDKVSLPLTGVLVACGAYVPMISGRGLGHTGGTLDKLQSIPGYRIDLSPEEMRHNMHEVHAVITGQTASLAPADRRMYAIRDVTGSVSSIPLITASILSKKLAEGIEALVLDVKVGSGAFMETLDAAERLADSLARVGSAAGVRVSALLTRMDEPLGVAIGNANEVAESVACLRGEGPADLETLVVALSAELLVDTGLASDLEAARKKAEEAIRSGEALEAFRRMVVAQGGDGRVIDDPGLLPAASLKAVVAAPEDGYLERVDARRVGKALIVLGGGRRVQEDRVDPSVGIRQLRKVGTRITAGEPILEVAANDEARLAEAVTMLEDAVRVGADAPGGRDLVLGRKRAGSRASDNALGY